VREAKQPILSLPPPKALFIPAVVAIGVVLLVPTIAKR
jgi:hypothetical protein